MKHEMEALTLEQLREMDGKPVWVTSVKKDGKIPSRWVLYSGKSESRDREDVYVFATTGGIAQGYKGAAYGKTWLAYDYPPAHIDREAWVSVSERMPDEHDSIFKKLIAKEKWGAGMFERLSDDVIVAIKFADGTRRSGFAHTKDGVWMGLPSIGCPVVTHWMPMPEPPEREG